MSYTFLQEQGEESSVECFSDIEQFVRLKLNLTAEKCSCNDNETESYRGSQSGMMCEPLTENRGGELQMLCAAGSPARTSVVPEVEKESKEKSPAFGEKWHGLLARYDRDMHSLRTVQCSLFEDLTECYVILPRWGILRDGGLWEQPTWGRLTNEIESGLWPTPSANKQTRSGKLVNADGTQWDGISKPHSAKTGKPVQTALLDKVTMWPTPTVCGNYNRKGASATSNDGLATAVKKWPTSTAQDAKNNGAPSQLERNTKPLNAEVGGPLNPPWVEWLMGWPLGWTDCAASAMDKFLLWRQAHGEF